MRSPSQGEMHFSHAPEPHSGEDTYIITQLLRQLFLFIPMNNRALGEWCIVHPYKSYEKLLTRIVVICYNTYDKKSCHYEN